MARTRSKVDSFGVYQINEKTNMRSRQEVSAYAKLKKYLGFSFRWMVLREQKILQTTSQLSHEDTDDVINMAEQKTR